MNIVTEPTATAQWQSLVVEAEDKANRTLSDTLESYLVFTLMRFTQRPDMLTGAMALAFMNGLNEQGQRRHDDLRDIGDQCLLFSGLFPRHAQRRLVRVSYFVNLGRSAYQQLHGELRHAGRKLYGQLASDFIAMTDVLLAMRSLNQETSALTPIEAYELWEDTGSPQALHTLQQQHPDATPIASHWHNDEGNDTLTH